MNFRRDGAKLRNAAQFCNRPFDVRQTDHRIPPEPSGTEGANLIDPGIVSSAKSVFELDIRRQGCVEQRRIDDLSFDTEAIQVSKPSLNIGQLLAANRNGLLTGMARSGGRAE